MEHGYLEISSINTTFLLISRTISTLKIASSPVCLLVLMHTEENPASLTACSCIPDRGRRIHLDTRRTQRSVLPFTSACFLSSASSAPFSSMSESAHHRHHIRCRRHRPGYLLSHHGLRMQLVPWCCYNLGSGKHVRIEAWSTATHHFG